MDDSKGGKINDIFRARLDTLYGASTAGNPAEVKKIVSKSFPTDLTRLDAKDSVVDTLNAPFGIISTASLNVN